MRRCININLSGVMNESLFLSPADLQKRLYGKYSASQIYFYPNKINEIVREKHTAVNIYYEDIEYLLDMEENLKRWYQSKEFDNKMFSFKEYYFYHQDCPRIFIKGIEQCYAKWQDRRRDLVYKKLKLIYNESYSSSADSQADDQKSQNYVAMSHFLLQISDYNPYSKKYYLRVAARKEKEQKRIEQDKKNQSKRDLQFLQHQLSNMLNDLSTLSEISTLSNRTPIKIDKDRPKLKRTYSKGKSQQISKSNSTNLSNSNSVLKFSFKKKKISVQKILNMKDPKKLMIKDHSRQKDALPDGRMSPKMGGTHDEALLLKSKSIFAVSTFAPLHKNSEFKAYPIKKQQQLKLNFDNKKLTLDDQPRKYQTEKIKQPIPQKNIVMKIKSVSKMEQRASLDKLPSRQGSVGKRTRNDQFSDKKMSGQGHNQFRMRSLKSEFIGKKSVFNVKPTLELDKGKRILELKNW